jgi:hypothetical protein
MWRGGNCARFDRLWGGLIAFYGYSYLVSVKPAAEQIVTALVLALEHAELKTTVSGSIRLSDNAIRVAPGQTIGLKEGAIVKLDQNSSIRVVGDLRIDVPQPSKSQLQLDATSTSLDLPITNYTIFKSVPYESGDAVTGWNFVLADTARPKHQTYYYHQDIERGIGYRQILAVNNFR